MLSMLMLLRKLLLLRIPLLLSKQQLRTTLLKEKLL